MHIITFSATAIISTTFAVCFFSTGVHNVMALIAYGVNQMIPGANYLYLARPEAAPSVLDILPPSFALRTLIITAVITVMYGLAYWPWYRKDCKEKRGV